LVFGEEGGEGNHERDHKSHEKVVHIVSDDCASFVNEAVFEAIVEVGAFDFIELAAEVEEVESPEGEC